MTTAQMTRAQEIVQKRMIDGNDHVKDVAKQLKLTPGKTAFIKMQILVENKTVPAITGTPAQKVAKSLTARKKADAISSWGWLAARTGMNEGTLKAACANKGYPVFGDRIAITRANKRNARRNARKNSK